MEIEKYIVYCTVNLINNKIYVGVHKTSTPFIFNGYIGNGITSPSCNKVLHPEEPFHYAVKKYGYKNFRRYTIFVFNTRQEALDMEAKIVNKEFIERKDTYNITLGGGQPPIHCTKVYQYDIDGNYIKDWDSISSIGKFFNTTTPIISNALRYKRAWRNYLWSYDKYEKLNIIDYNLARSKNRIYQYDENGEFIKFYYSIAECARDNNIACSNLIDSIKYSIKIKKFYFSKIQYDKFIKPEVIPLTGQINMFDLDGSYLMSFKTFFELRQYMNNDMRNLNQAIRKGNSYKGYLWSRGEIENITPVSNARRVGQYTLEGELVKIYDSVQQARKDFTNVTKVLMGKANKTKGYTFKYID